MLVAFDTDVLSLLLHPNAVPPVDPQTGQPVTHAKQRLEFLVSELQRTKAKVIIPAPALAEFLVIADKAGPDYLTIIDKMAVFRVQPFDTKAATEAAASTRQALHDGNKKAGATGNWQCVKTDRQIAAICRTEGIKRIYSNDGDMRTIGTKSDIEVIHVGALPIPPADAPLLEMIEKAESEDEATTLASSSIATEPPFEQSPSVEPETTPSPEPVRPEAPQAAPGPPPPGSSLGAPLKPPSGE